MKLRMKVSIRYGLILTVILLCRSVFAQTPTGTPTTSSPQDSVIIFSSPRPLLDQSDIQNNQFLNSWGVAGFFNDYGWGLGFYFRHIVTADLSAIAQLDLGTAKGSREFGAYNEIKINRIFVFPLLVSAQYRLLQSTLGESFRPYITAGAGPVFVMTNDGQKDYFSALPHSTFHTTWGANVGIGSYFGSDPKTTFGASFKFFIIPYPAPGIESTLGNFLTNFSGIALSVSYGFNF